MQVMVNICMELARKGHEVLILDRKYSKDDPDQEEWEGVRIIRFAVPEIRPRGMPRFIDFLLAEFNAVTFTLAVSRYLRKHSAGLDVIHVHYSSIGLILAMLNRGLRRRMLYTCHLGLWTSTGGPRLLERVELWVDTLFMRRADRIVALSGLMKEVLVRRAGIPEDKVEVVPNGVDSQFFRPDIKTDSVVERYDLAGHEVILFVGRLAKMKGVDCLINAAKKLVKDMGFAKARFLLVGPCGYDATEEPMGRDQLDALVRSLGLETNVTLTGSMPLEDLRMLYTASDVFVLPSQFEGDPLVTLEAMASGKPVVATRVGGIPRQVRDGFNGFLVEPNDADGLADRIRTLIEDREVREQMGRNARSFVEAEAGWSSVVQRLLEVYTDIGETGRI